MEETDWRLKPWQNDALDANANRKEVAELLRHIGYRDSRQARTIVRELESRSPSWAAGEYTYEIRYPKTSNTREAIMVNATGPGTVIYEICWEDDEVVIRGDVDPGPGIIRRVNGDVPAIIKTLDEVAKLIRERNQAARRSR